MKKKKFLTLGNVLYLLTAIIGVVAIFLIFTPAYKVTGSVLDLSGETTYSGLEVTFGFTANDFTYFAFSFMNLLSYLLVLVAIIFTVLRLCGKLKSKIFDYISIALFVVSGIFFLCTASFVVMSEAYANAIKLANAITTTVTTSVGIGAILSGVLSLISAVLLVLKNVLKKAK